jgi:6,7-dimethyl-8-ribityllumazine synthase
MGTYEAIICLGAVIRGGTDHYTYVCNQVSDGCAHVALQNDIPVIFGVLTTESEEQAKDRAGGKEGNKGRDAVDAAVETVNVLRQIG